MEHSFDTELAKKYGVHEAIILKHLQFWIVKNKANNKHFHDNHYWTYNSVKAFNEIFSYLTPRQINYAIEKLIKSNILITGNYNDITFDRTLWYAFKNENTWLTSTPILQKSKMRFSKIVKSIYRTDTIPYRISLHLFEKIKERNPDHLEPNFQKWCKEIDLMITKEKRDPEEILQIIDWCQSDTFWQNNILTTSKLRDKYDQLKLKRGSSATSNNATGKRGELDVDKYERLLNHNTE